MGKRAFDFTVALLALVLLSPVLIVLACVVRAKLGSPVLFRQLRPGLHGELFEMIKFRTMLDAYDEQGRELPDEERMTDFGRTLRASSLDELPELWNVLKGEMSFVGPRPLLPDYLQLYNVSQRRRHEVRPGITGWAQINGRNAIDWSSKFELDTWYVENQSFWLDIRILWKTVRKVIVREGISSDGEVTMSKFEGNKE